MRVVVSGGTGFIGRALVTSLSERGDDVVVLSREHAGVWKAVSQRCCPGAGKIELASWTPDREGSWGAVVDGADAVVHLAGAGVLDVRWSPERLAVVRASRVRSTELLAAAVARAAIKPRVFVSGSAVGYYGTKTLHRILTEGDPPGTDFLAELTRDWEAAAAPARDAGVRVCHPRVGLVLGRGGGILARMVPAFKAYLGGPIGDGAQYMPWIHLADVVRAFEYAIAEDHTAGAFNLTAPEPVTMNEFARALGVALGRPSAVRVPAAVVRLALGAGAEVVLSGQRAIPRRLVDAGFAFLYPELASALADLLSRS